MRHTAATLWLASGEAPEWIARQLGHTSTEMLFRVYSRYVPNLTRRDGSAMERLLKQHISVAPVCGIVVQLPEERAAIEAESVKTSADAKANANANANARVSLGPADPAPGPDEDDSYGDGEGEGEGDDILSLDELSSEAKSSARSSPPHTRRRRSPRDSPSLVALFREPDLPAFLKQD